MEEQERVYAIESSAGRRKGASSPGKIEPRSRRHNEAEEPWWKALVEFACHVFVATLIFLLMALPAVGLDFLLQWLESFKINGLILRGLSLVKKAVFVVDLLLFLICLANMSWHFLRSMTWRKQ